MPARKHRNGPPRHPSHSGHWIKGAVHHPGAFTRYAKKHHWTMGKAIRKSEHSRNSHVRHMAQFAANMRSIARKHHLHP
jgi:hypothetical protein